MLGMFAAEFEPAQHSSRRPSRRASVSLDVGFERDGLARTLCKVIDISIHGARLQSYSSLLKNSAIWLTLPGTGTVAADVMWADDYVAVCRFHRPLDPAAFDVLLERQGTRMA
jgi:hypothetical protein